MSEEFHMTDTFNTEGQPTGAGGEAGPLSFKNMLGSPEAPGPKMDITEMFNLNPLGKQDPELKQVPEQDLLKAGDAVAKLGLQFDKEGEINYTDIGKILGNSAPGADLEQIGSLMKNFVPADKQQELLGAYANASQEAGGARSEDDVVPLPPKDVVDTGTGIIGKIKPIVEQAQEAAKEGIKIPEPVQLAMDKAMVTFQEWISSNAFQYTSKSIIVAIFVMYILLIQSFRMAGRAGGTGK